jgi:alpha-mannosidase
MNRECEMLLENGAEPLSVMASTVGKEYPKDMLRYAWKSLMKNHPHDSICGCSCDEVNAEVKSRFDRSNQAAKAVIDDNLEFISKHIDTKGFEDCDAAFVVLNTMEKFIVFGTRQ